jgi:Tfp pilus assembly protein PilX
MSTPLANQRGIALFTVLGLLSVLLILASLVAGSSRIESALTGTDRRSAQAFNAADAGLGYALGDANNFTDPTKCCLSATCNPALPIQTNLATDAGLPVTGTVASCFEYEAPPPIEIKVSALKFKGFYFDVRAVGTATDNAQSNLDMEATRLGPAS